jgi:hypothetical protein
MAEQITLDIEPTWEALCNLAQGGALPPEELMPACKIADIVRQAQKKGATAVEFRFSKEDRNIFLVVLEMEGGS